MDYSFDIHSADPVICVPRLIIQLCSLPEALCFSVKLLNLLDIHFILLQRPATFVGTLFFGSFYPKLNSFPKPSTVVIGKVGHHMPHNVPLNLIRTVYAI